MNFSIAKTICALLAPRHELSCSYFLWRKLLKGLRSRGTNYSRESGAFLLGINQSGRARVKDFILYDDLDPHSLDTGIVRFDGRFFGALWEICKERGLTVVADIHVHPYGVEQSDSDIAHPMIARTGHLALILPRFVKGRIKRKEIGIYRYRGAKRWEGISTAKRRQFFSIGF